VRQRVDVESSHYGGVKAAEIKDPYIGEKPGQGFQDCSPCRPGNFLRYSGRWGDSPGHKLDAVHALKTLHTGPGLVQGYPCQRRPFQGKPEKTGFFQNFHDQFRVPFAVLPKGSWIILVQVFKVIDFFIP